MILLELNDLSFYTQLSGSPFCSDSSLSSGKLQKGQSVIAKEVLNKNNGRTRTIAKYAITRFYWHYGGECGEMLRL